MPMQIHSDTLTDNDLAECLPAPQLHLNATPRPSRRRARAWEVRLEWLGGRHPGRRRRNSGVYGTEGALAATWDEHGEWFARLFERDPAAIVGPYAGAAAFHKLTGERYARQVTA